MSSVNLSSMDAPVRTHDPYTHGHGEERAPPATLWGRLKHLGPSLIVSGSIVGSGEILLTSALGAQAGFVLLWWVLLSCWSKSVLQAEFARYIVASGDTYLRAMNRIPGRIRGPKGPVAWPIWLGIIAFVPGVFSVGGILGGAGQALALLIPVIDSTIATMVLAGIAMGILASGSYLRLEKVMLLLVGSFTLITLTSALLMQTTDFAMTADDLAAGFTLEFPAATAVLALAMYGYTGVNSGEVSAYTYWCIEKGYPRYVGGDRGDPDWARRARGWIRVLQLDVVATLVILTCATLPFYVLGAGVLHEQGAQPRGLETVTVLSGMFTATLGPGSLWLFGTGAFFILFSTTLASLGAGGRFIPDYLIELGFLDRHAIDRRLFIRGYALVMPVLGTMAYLWIQSPVALVTVAAVIAAMMLPIQSGATLWLQRHHMDQRVRPGVLMRAGLWLTFALQLMLGSAVIAFVVL